jgi:hypothetical protein
MGRHVQRAEPWKKVWNLEKCRNLASLVPGYTTPQVPAAWGPSGPAEGGLIN